MLPDLKRHSRLALALTALVGLLGISAQAHAGTLTNAQITAFVKAQTAEADAVTALVSQPSVDGVPLDPKNAKDVQLVTNLLGAVQNTFSLIGDGSYSSSLPFAEISAKEILYYHVQALWVQMSSPSLVHSPFNVRDLLVDISHDYLVEATSLETIPVLEGLRVDQIVANSAMHLNQFAVRYN